jgi:hypothetical protein
MPQAREGNQPSDVDLVVFTIPGVQRYISESRTTSDLVSASTQVSALAVCAAEAFRSLGGVVVIPASTPAPTRPAAGSRDYGAAPNRIVATTPAGQGSELAVEVSQVVQAMWRSWVSALYLGRVPSTPGFPDPQWVCVPPLAGGYGEQFAVAQRALAARRRVRSFTRVLEQGQELCSLSARWPVAPPPAGTTPALRARPHEVSEKLSAVNWVKRAAPHRRSRPATPSTSAIASAPFRAAVFERLSDPATRLDVGRALLALHEVAAALGAREAPVPGLAVPPGLSREVQVAAGWLVESGGGWTHPDQWSDSAVAASLTERGEDAPSTSVDVSSGRRAAKALAEAVGQRSGTHLAVIAQDLDNMGLFLSGSVAPREAGLRLSVDPGEHTRVSAALQDLAEYQVTIAKGGRDGHGLPGGQDRERRVPAGHLHGVPVYAGGDDVLFLAPAATALDLAVRVHDAVQVRDDLPWPSTAVLFFHQRSSLQGAIARAQDLLHEAKQLPGKHGLAIGYERRSGGQYASVMPWMGQDGGTKALVAALSASNPNARRLSRRLVTDLERDRVALASLLRSPDGKPVLTAELTRLVARHSDTKMSDPWARELGGLLLVAGRQEMNPDPDAAGFDPVPAARVGVFVRQEAR